MNDEFTRREALTRFAVVAGGVASSSLIAGTPAYALTSGELTPARQQIFESIADAFSDQSSVEMSRAALVNAMTTRYASSDPSYRQWVDSVLDIVDTTPSGARFRARGRAERRRLLKAWSRQSESADTLLTTTRDHAPRQSFSSGVFTVAAEIQAAGARLDDVQRRPDPVTALLPDAPPAASVPPIADGKGAYGTPVRMHRFVYQSTYSVLASAIVSDERDFPTDVFA